MSWFLKAGLLLALPAFSLGLSAFGTESEPMAPRTREIKTQPKPEPETSAQRGSDRVIHLCHDIDAETAEWLCGELRDLERDDPRLPVTIMIASHGGHVTAMQMIIKTMKMASMDINTIAIGNTYSAAACILAAGTGRRAAVDDCVVAIHINPHDKKKKRASDHPDFSRAERFNPLTERFWKRHANLPDSAYPMETEKWINLTPEEALKFDVIDEIISIESLQILAGGAQPVASGDGRPAKVMTRATTASPSPR